MKDKTILTAESVTAGHPEDVYKRQVPARDPR